MQHPFFALTAASLLIASWAPPSRAADIISIPDVPQERYQDLHQHGDFWGVDPKTGSVTMSVTERQRAAIEALGFETRIDTERSADLAYARSFDSEAWRRSGAGGIPGFACYRTVDETKADLSAMASERPDLARWEPIGESWLEANGEPGGDDLYVLILGNQNSPHDQPPFILMAAQHARELTTAETATRFAEWLFDNYDSNATARWLLDHREIHIVAQQNPDGRREVEAGASDWRKNSNRTVCPEPNNPGDWIGVDLNRNNDYFFNGPSTGPACDQTYPGDHGASEPETQAIQSYMDQVFDRHRPGSPDDLPTDPVVDTADGLFISLHSYGNLVLFPWEGKGSGASNHSPNHDQLAWLGRRFGFFTGYQIGRAILYAAGGTTPDYAYGEFGVAAYTYEIGSTFQESCSAFENNLWPDLRESLVYAAKAARRPYQAPSGPDVVDARAVLNTRSGTLNLTGMADDTRFDRNGVSEGPASDPISEVAEIRASFDLPPDQAASTFAIAPDSSNPVSAFSAQVDPGQSIDLPRMLFFQATDSQGNVGVPEAVWITEQRAAVSPAELNVILPAGQTDERGVTIANIGSATLNWSMATDLPAFAGDAHNPVLDETLDVGDFVLSGGGSASADVNAGVQSRGQVVGFSFAGTVSNLGSGSWASDMAMTIAGPEGESFIVGGYQTTHPDWDFQGGGSQSPGTYTSTHVGSEIFGSAGAMDEGTWSFDFEDTWTGGMDWADVTVTLHKQEAPSCIDPAGVPWLSLSESSGSLAPDDESVVDVTFNTVGLNAGTYDALICVSTNDPSAELIQVGVSMQVLSGDPQIFDDRFENGGR